MLSASAGAASDTTVGSRAVLEPAVGASPDDVSEGDRLNLGINNFSPSQVDVVPDIMSLGVCSISECRGGGHDVASTPTPDAVAPDSFVSVVHGVVLEALGMDLSSFSSSTCSSS
jgi:hypothetical protein